MAKYRIPRPGVSQNAGPGLGREAAIFRCPENSRPEKDCLVEPISAKNQNPESYP
jgi:hypothetical protein